MPNENNKNGILQWQALEFEHHEKGLGWYFTFAIIAAMIIAYYFYTRDYFGALFWIFIAAAIFLYARRRPQEVAITLSGKGITVGEEFFPYTQIKSFWIVDKHYVRAVHIETTAYLNKVIVILIRDEIDPENVRRYLAKYIPQGTHDQETVTEIVARFLKF